MDDNCRIEIVELHQFFQDWFNAVIPDIDESFSRLDHALGSRFELIGPEGKVAEREGLVAGLRSVYGQWKDNPGRIWIENMRRLHAEDNVVLFSYEEWQEVDGETAVRLSSVLFGVDTRAPNGVEWLHLHEVWKPQ